MPRIDKPCHICGGRGVLWLGGKDYVDDPECEGTGRITGFIEYISPLPRHFAMNAKHPRTVFRRDTPKPRGVVISERRN